MATTHGLYAKTRYTSVHNNEVELSCKIVRVIAIDSACGTVAIEFLCVAHWHDASLVGADRAAIDWAHAFVPKLSVSNSVDIEQTYRNLRLMDSRTGLVALTCRFRGTVSQQFQLGDFPFDVQKLELSVRCGHPTELAHFVYHHDRLNTIEPFQLPDWSVGRGWIEISESDPCLSGSNKSYSFFTAYLFLARRSQYFMWNFALIVFLISGTALTSFCIPPDSFADRSSLNLALLLTLTALKLVIADYLPKISYQTLLDRYVVASTLFLFLVVAQNAWVATAQQSVLWRAEVDAYSFRVVAGAWVLMQLLFVGIALVKVRRQKHMAGDTHVVLSTPDRQRVMPDHGSSGASPITNDSAQASRHTSSAGGAGDDGGATGGSGPDLSGDDSASESGDDDTEGHGTGHGTRQTRSRGVNMAAATRARQRFRRRGSATVRRRATTPKRRTSTNQS